MSKSNNAFGGERNLDNLAYIFDAKQKPSCYNSLALAVSDGTIRSIDIREKNLSTIAVNLNIAEQSSHICRGHPTSVSLLINCLYFVWP